MKLSKGSITPAQRRILQRLKAGENCGYSTFKEAWRFSGDDRVMRMDTAYELLGRGLVVKKFEGSGFAKKRWLELTEKGLAEIV